MKINDKTKGISYHPHGLSDEEELDLLMSLDDDELLLPDSEQDYVLDMIEQNKAAQLEWDKQGEINLKKLMAKQKPLVEQFKKDQAKAKIKNQKINYNNSSYIGERIVFLMDKNNQEIAEFCRNIGMSRSSLHRYIKGSFLPSEKSLRKIIDGLFVSVADFCYEPNDFEKWKASFVQSDDTNDIFKFKKYVLSNLHINNFTYKNNGITMRLPHRYFDLFRSLVKTSFGIFDLLPHDKEQ